MIPLAFAVGSALIHADGPLGLSAYTFGSFAKARLFEILVTLAVIAYAGWVVRDARIAPYWTRTMTWCAVLGGVLTITALTGQDRAMSIFSDGETADGLLFLAHVGMYALLLAWTIRDDRVRFARFLRIAVVSGLATLLVLIPDVVTRPSGIVAASAWITTSAQAFGNPNYAAHWAFLLLGAVAILHALRPRRWHGGACAVFLAYLTILSSFTALFLSLALVWILVWRAHRRIAYSVALVGLVGALALVASGHLRSQSTSLVDSMTIRAQIWREGSVIVLREHPLLGYGWENADLIWNDATSDVFARAYSANAQGRSDKMHNVVLEVFVAGGSIAALLILAAWVRIIVMAGKRAWQTHDPIAAPFACVLAIAFLYLLLNFDSPMSFVLTAVLIGGATALMESRRTLPLPRVPRMRIALACTIAVSGTVLIIGLHAPAAHAYALQTRVEILRWTRPLRSPVDAEPMLALLEQSLTIRTPYDFARKDAVDVGMRMFSRDVLSSSQRTHLHALLAHTMDALAAAHPKNPDLHHRRAWVASTFGDRAKEVSSLTDAISVAPANGAFRYQLAYIHLRDGRPADAMALFVALRDAGLFGAAPQFGIGIATIMQNDLVGGRRIVEQAMTIYAPTTAEWKRLTAAQRAAGATDAAIAAWYTQSRAFAAAPDGVTSARERMGTSER